MALAIARTNFSEQTSGARLSREDDSALAAHIRSLRKARKYTLDKLSELSGVSRAALSKIERGEISPTYGSLCKIADGLQLSVSNLVAASDAKPYDGVEVSRASEAPGFETPLYHHQLLAQRDDGKRMTSFLSKVKARKLSDYAEYDRHDSEDFVFVLEGRVRIYLEGREPVELGPRDSLYMCSQIPHALISLCPTESEDGENKEFDDATILWTNASPN